MSTEPVRFTAYTWTVKDILLHYEDGSLELSPGFQRKSVWRQRDRALLVESILHNFPLPSIFLYKRTERGDSIFDVLDGKQRLETLLMFLGKIRGDFREARVRMPGADRDEVLTWTKLKRREQQKSILGYKLQIIEVDGDFDQVRDIFVRINSTGRALTKPERQHAHYFNSDFLKRAREVARRHAAYLRDNRIVSASQQERMKHVEFVCELIVSAHYEDVVDQRTVLDRVMQHDTLKGRALDAAVSSVVHGLTTLKRLFPDLGATRFRSLADFYSLVVLVQRFERAGLVLQDRKRNALAREMLLRLSNGVDGVAEKVRRAEGASPAESLYRDYYLTVREGTGQLRQRRRREEILRGLLEPLFEVKDSRRLFSEEQRRILWNTTETKRCAKCRKTLSWENFTVDHIAPHSLGGRTALENAGLLCRADNSAKGNRQIVL